MTIFKHYTGNALLNNALQTIEILGQVDCVSEITPQLLEKLYVDKHLLETNLCLKSNIEAQIQSFSLCFYH